MSADLERIPNRHEGLLGYRFVLWLSLVLVFAMAARTAIDSDMWWHLRAGEQTWTTRTVTLQDTFSYTRTGAAWTNHSWLAQVVMYLAYRLGGFTALGAMVALLAVLSMYLIFIQMDGPPILRAFIIVLSSLVAALVWSPRPQMASIALFALVGFLLYLYKWQGKDRLWLLLPIFILWSNLHAGYVLGFILIGSILAGEILNHILGFHGNEILTWKRIGRLGMWGFAAGLAVLINPNGLQTWLVPFKTVEVNALQNLISEWASPDFHQIAQQPFIWLLLADVAAIGLSSRRLDGSDLVCLALFGYSALVARRNFGPFALTAAPILSRHLWPAITAWWERIKTGAGNKLIHPDQSTVERKTPRFLSIFQVSLVVLLALAGMAKLGAVNSPQIIADYLPTVEPVGAVEWLKANQPAGRLFNSYNWGGYLEWALRDYPVFVDGRTDLYNDVIIGQWVQVVSGDAGWQEALDRWGVRLVLLEPDRPLTRLLPEAGWKLLYQDKISVLYGR